MQRRVSADAAGHRRGRDSSGRTWSRASTRPAAPTSSSTTCLGSDGKWRNSASASSPTWCRRPSCSHWLEGRKLDAVIHLGAISDTTATDGDLVMDTNFRLSLRLLDWCTGDPHAVHLCVVGGDLWRRRRTASTTTGRRGAQAARGR